jgi:hypothetical protein
MNDITFVGNILGECLGCTGWFIFYCISENVDFLGDLLLFNIMLIRKWGNYTKIYFHSHNIYQIFIQNEFVFFFVRLFSLIWHFIHLEHIFHQTPSEKQCEQEEQTKKKTNKLRKKQQMFINKLWYFSMNIPLNFPFMMLTPCSWWI